MNLLSTLKFPGQNDAHEIADAAARKNISEQAAQIEKNTADISQLSEEIANLGTIAGNIPSNTETFTFTLEDGTEVVKEVYVKT